MRLGDLLVRANLVTVEDVARALDRTATNGRRLGDNLVALGAIGQEALDGFLKRIPAEPPNIAATGIDAIDLLGLLMRVIYTAHLETCREFVDAIKLPYHIVAELVKMGIDRQLLRTLGLHRSDSPLDMGYAFTEEGKRWTLDALDRSRYAGPAPVTIDEFTLQVNLQKLTNEVITSSNSAGRR